MSLFSQYAKAKRHNQALAESQALLREAKRALRKYAQRLTDRQTVEVRAAITELEAARASALAEGTEDERLGAALGALDQKLDTLLAFARKSTFREYVESIGVAVIIALILRAFVVEAFKIPSGSMLPTLQVGDHIFVNKFIYGVRVPFTNIKFGENFRPPKRGEVIVFKFPKDQSMDFIKRIVAVAGDTVEVRDNQVYVNGKPVPRQHSKGACHYEDFDEVTSQWQARDCDAWRETVNGETYTTVYDKNGAVHSFHPVTVPPRSVFCMGDNRDNSNDSRFWGFVPYDLIKGKAMIVWWSLGPHSHTRYNRMFKLIE